MKQAVWNKRVVVRLAWSVLLSLIIVGVMAGYHSRWGILFGSLRSQTIFQVGAPEGYELWRYGSLQTRELLLDEGESMDWVLPVTITNERVPAWALRAAEAGESWHSRVSLGRPLAFARYEGTQERWLGLVPTTTRLEFPGFLVLVGLVYGGLSSVRWLKRLPAAWLRNRRDRRRGLCEQCGYDLAGLAGGACPECGARGLQIPDQI